MGGGNKDALKGKGKGSSKGRRWPEEAGFFYDEWELVFWRWAWIGKRFESISAQR